jgi:hypothetical protein
MQDVNSVSPFDKGSNTNNPHRRVYLTEVKINVYRIIKAVLTGKGKKKCSFAPKMFNPRPLFFLCYRVRRYTVYAYTVITETVVSTTVS